MAKITPERNPRLINLGRKNLLALPNVIAGGGPSLNCPSPPGRPSVTFGGRFRQSCDAIDQPGSGEITISTSYDRKNDLILVTIRDNGHGIAPERLEKIFKPFYTTKDKGIGLGLSICKDTVAKHRGAIRVESTLHKGATVLVSLPVSTRHI